MIITKNLDRVLITLIFNIFFIKFSVNTTSIFTSDYNNNNNNKNNTNNNNNDDRTILLNEIQLKNLINLNTKNFYNFSINNNNNSRNNNINNYYYYNNNKISSSNKINNTYNSNSSGEYNNRTGKFYFDAIFRIGSDFGNFFDYNDGDDDVDYDQSSNVKVCDCECGTSNEQNRIVGGIPTGVNQFPWMARLVYDGKFHCGGTLLTKDYVLTAAHCVKRLRRSKIRIILGDHDQYITTESKAIQRAVTSIVKHRKFDSNTYNNDIALLRLRKPVVFSKIIKPVCLPKANYDPAGKVATVVGWGRTSEGGELPSTVNHVKVHILSLNECRNKKYKSTRITTSMLCAGGSRMDSCQGDSGGPLLLSSGYKYHVVGIVSWGVGCGREGYPGVYTRVPKFVPWIKANLDNTCLCQ